MGANESTTVCINFNRSNRFYFAAEQILGCVVFQNSKEKLKLDEIFLELVGEISYTREGTRTVQDNDGDSRTEVFREDMYEEFYQLRLSLVKPDKGESSLVLTRGEYKWPFQFCVPEHLPPSIGSNLKQNPSIKYYIRSVLDKSWYKTDDKQIFPIIICPRVNLHSISSTQQPIKFYHRNRADFELKGHLLRGGIAPGESFDVEIHVENPNRCEVDHIEMLLVQHRRVNEDRAKLIVLRKHLDELNSFHESSLNKNFHLVLPSVYLAPTYELSTSSLNISISYDVVLDVKVRGMLKDFQITNSLIIGTDPIAKKEYQLEHQNSDYFESSFV